MGFREAHSIFLPLCGISGDACDALDAKADEANTDAEMRRHPSTLRDGKAPETTSRWIVRSETDKTAAACEGDSQRSSGRAGAASPETGRTGSRQNATIAFRSASGDRRRRDDSSRGRGCPVSGHRASTGNPLGGYPAEGQYGHKKDDLEAIAPHVPPGTVTFAEPFGGTGVVAAMAKDMGFEVMTNDVMAFSALRLRVFVENDGVTLGKEDVRLLTAADVRRESGAVERWYGEAMGRGNAAFLDGVAASLHLLDGGMKRDVAVCLAVLCVMRRMAYPSVRFANDGGFAGRRPIRQADLRAGFRKLALDEFPSLVRVGARPCRASRGDAIAFTAGATCDVLYADPPFPSPGGLYERDLAFYDKLVHVLQGHPERVDRPYNGPVALPPHADFTKRPSALMSIKLLFKAARGVRRIIFSFNSTSAVLPHEIVRAARDWYGGLAACEWRPGRIPASGLNRRRFTANSLMVFDRGQPTASPKWTPDDITFADLFSGAGGFRSALQSAGGRCVFSSEIDEPARATYSANWGERPSGDITKISPDDVPEHQVLCAGFPCPAFSNAGKGGGFTDERGKLFFEIPRIAAIRRPCVLLLENVPAFASPGKPWLQLATEVLEGIGYRVFWKVIDAGQHGVRTARKRVYIVCIRRDLGIPSFEFPEPTLEPVRLADALLPDDQTAEYVVRGHPVTIHPDAEPPAGAAAGLKVIRVGHVGDGDRVRQGYRIYSPAGLAITFMRRGGGVGAQTGLYLVNGKVRKLAPREMARCMGFPDSFVIPPSLSYEQARRLFGNSVAVPVVRQIFDCVVRTLSAPHPTGA